MAKLNGRITKLVAGDIIPIERTFTDVTPISATISQVLFMVKAKEKDPDSAAIISIVLTTGNSAEGKINDAIPADGSIGFNCIIQPAKSILLKPKKDYFYAFKAIDTSGGPYHLEKGIINLERSLITTV